MRTLLLAIVTLAIGTATADAGKHRQSKYIGIHPVPKVQGGGFCYIEGPHVHVFGADKLQYRDHRGHNHFVGDPVAYGYDGPKYAYKGNHPIEVHAVVGTPEVDTEFCYLDAAHYHYYAPPSGPEFKVVGDVHFYVSEPPRAYIEARPAYVGINATYRPITYARPVVEVEAPVGWIGARVDIVGPPPVVVAAPRARVDVIAPAAIVDVHIPAPTLKVEFGIGAGVHVDSHRHRHYRGHGKHKHKKWKHKKHRGRW